MRLILTSLAWLIGIFTGSFLPLSGFWMLTGILPVGFCFFFKQHRRRLVALALVLTAFGGGAAWSSDSLADAPALFIPEGKTRVEITGVISRPPERRDQTTHLTVDLKSLNSQTASGRILLFAGHYPEYYYGDVIRIEGKLAEPPRFDTFDYQAYLAVEGIQAVMFAPDIELVNHRQGLSLTGWIFDLRQSLSEILAASLPEPQAGLVQGIFLGIRSTISADLKEALMLTGATHLIAISGINLSLIAGLVLALALRLLGRRHYIYVWISLSIVWFYAGLSGLQPPVVRAAIMASVFLLSELLGRLKWASPTLFVSAAVMVGLDPQLLWNVSFQLSFLSMAGLVYLTPLFQEPLDDFLTARWGESGWRTGLALPVLDSFCVSLGAMLAIVPVLALNFGVISLVGAFTTFLISPVMPVIIVLCAFTAFSGLISLSVSRIIGLTAWVFITYMLLIIQAFAALPLVALSTGRTPAAFPIVYYTVLILGIHFKREFAKIQQFWLRIKQWAPVCQGCLERIPWRIVVWPLLVAALISTLAAATQPDSRLSVSFLDVGEGEAVLVREGGYTILIDGGPSPQQISLELGDILPFWDRHIDLLVLTHPHLDHISGLVEVIQRYRIGQVLTTGLVSNHPVFQEWQYRLNEKALDCTVACRGQTLRLNSHTLIEVLNPSMNDTGETADDLESGCIVLKISRGQQSFLLPADIVEETEMKLIKERADLSARVLKASHHGSANANCAAWLGAVQPQFVVISCGADNRYGHPSSAALERFAGQTVFRTDLQGTIEFITDGRDLRVRTAEPWSD